LGHGDGEQKEEPSRVEVFVGKQAVGVACGSSHTAVTTIHGWVPDQESSQCMACKAGFTTIRRRHHCRKCGGLYCGACTTKRIPILNAGFSEPVRVCDKCYSALSSKRATKLI